MFLDSELISDGCIDFRIMNNLCFFAPKGTISYNRKKFINFQY